MSQIDATVVSKVDRVKERFEIPKEDLWNVEALYPSWQAWEEDLERWARPKL
jgi:hypothetical protein